MSWQYFTRDEFACNCGCGTNRIQNEIIDLCEQLRKELKIPLVVTSGYRCPNHPVEANKVLPGRHTEGIAVDLRMPNGSKMREALDILLLWDVAGIGVGKRFIHIDMRDSTPVVWGYGS
jgi:uncharacterized protein YcbK (DUF882 family)